MRVLYVEFVNGFGGSLTTLLDMLDALDHQVEPILMIPYDPRPYRSIPSNVEIRIVAPPQVSRRSLGKWGTMARHFQVSRGWVRIVDRVVREAKPVLIHANNASAANLPAGLSGRRFGIPVVSHQRDMEYPGWPNRLILKSRLFSHHIASSHATAQSLIKLGLSPERCSTIYEPIREPSRLNRRIKAEGEPLVVAMYSLLLPWKGQEVFLRAISEVRKRVNQPFRVVVGGKEPFGDRGYLSRLKELTVELGLEHTIEFTGFTTDVVGRLCETDVLVLGSVDPEPGGHIVAEAMICGVPVVVTDDGGPSEYVRDSGGGCVLPRGVVERMADAIQRLLVDQGLRAISARRGQDYARRAFDPVTIGRQISSIYRTCLNSQREPVHNLEVT